jgi:hypothetical protein
MVVWYYFRPGFLNNQAQFFVFEGSEKKFQAYKNFFPGLQKIFSRPAKILFQAYVLLLSGKYFWYFRKYFVNLQNMGICF